MGAGSPELLWLFGCRPSIPGISTLQAVAPRHSWHLLVMSCMTALKGSSASAPEISDKTPDPTGPRQRPSHLVSSAAIRPGQGVIAGSNLRDVPQRELISVSVHVPVPAETKGTFILEFRVQDIGFALKLTPHEHETIFAATGFASYG